MSTYVLRVALLGWLIIMPGAARAFSDPTLFGQVPLAAGGGGRYFTGSPADGYSCKVCHEGGPETKLSVSGLPLGGYVLGARYEIIVSWPMGVEKFALAVELTDERGKRAGALRVPPPAEVQPEEYCEPASDMILAAAISEAPDARQIINLPDCGAKRLRFLWTAPSTNVGPVWFAGSAVTSDGEGDVYHDGVTDFGRVISSSAVASLATGTCSVRGGVNRSAGEAGYVGALLLALVWLRRKARPRKACSVDSRDNSFAGELR